MLKKEFNPKEYEAIKRRKEKLEERLARDHGIERETAEKLLQKVDKKLKEYEQTHDIPEHINITQEEKLSSYYDGDSSYRDNRYSWRPNPNFKWYYDMSKFPYEYEEETRTEEQLINDLGILYMIFGSTYTTYINYHEYKVRLLKKEKNVGNAFLRMRVDIYEDKKMIAKRVIGFWPFHEMDTAVGDIECSSDEKEEDLRLPKRKPCGDYIKKVAAEMRDIWNSYTQDDSPREMIEMNSMEYITQKSKETRISIQEEANHALEVIKSTELALEEMEERYEEVRTIPYWIAGGPYKNLESFLEDSGVVYQIRGQSLYIWYEDENEFLKFAGYERSKNFNVYIVLLLPKGMEKFV